MGINAPHIYKLPKPPPNSRLCIFSEGPTKQITTVKKSPHFSPHLSRVPRGNGVRCHFSPPMLFQSDHQRKQTSMQRLSQLSSHLESANSSAIKSSSTPHRIDQTNPTTTFSTMTKPKVVITRQLIDKAQRLIDAKRDEFEIIQWHSEKVHCTPILQTSTYPNPPSHATAPGSFPTSPMPLASSSCSPTKSTQNSLTRPAHPSKQSPPSPSEQTTSPSPRSRTATSASATHPPA
jgi:hypothetical protein